MPLTIIWSLVLGLLLQTGPEPRITTVTPDKLTVNAKAQVLTVAGENFGNNFSLQVTTPGGAVRTVDPKSIQQPQKTSFRVPLMLDEVGRYELVVLNGDGRKSSPFTVQVRAAARQPWIDRVEPEDVPRQQDPQSITLTGRNFETGLRISVTDPTGNVAQASTIDRVTPMSVVFRFAFETSGRYELLLTSPNGEASNVAVISVR